MRFNDYTSFINEALNISEIRPYITIWKELGGEERYKEWFGGKWRVYLDLIEKTDVYKQVEQILNDNGYEIVNYYENKAKKVGDDKNEPKIGKLLNRFASELAAKYANDKDKTQSNSEYKVVISRHPYDVVGMSTDRKWHSCMDIRGGSYSEHIEDDVREGTIVAYVVENDDLNINNPVNRLAIKVYENDNDDSILASDANVYFGSYDKEIVGFRETVDIWLDERQKDIPVDLYKLRGTLYDDGKHIHNNSKNIKSLKDRYDSVSDFNSFTKCATVKKDNLYGCVNLNGEEIIPVEYMEIKHLTEDYIAVDTEDGMGIFDIKKGEIVTDSNFDNYVYKSYDFIMLTRPHNNKKMSFIFNGELSEAFDRVFKINYPFFVVESKEKHGILNGNDFTYSLPMEYDDIGHISYDDDFLYAIKGSIYTIIKMGEVIAKGFDSGIIKPKILHDDYIQVAHNSLYGLLDLDGNQILPCKYYGIEPYFTSSGDMFVIKTREGDDTYYGLADSTGKVLHEPTFSYIMFIDNGFHIRTKEGKEGILNFNGKVGWYN
jgi:hypothetical protein